MMIKDFTKEKFMKFKPANPKVVCNNKNKTYYEIEYDAVYTDGHVEKHIGFGSYKLEMIKEYLRDCFEIDVDDFDKYFTDITCAGGD